MKELIVSFDGLLHFQKEQSEQYEPDDEMDSDEVSPRCMVKKINRSPFDLKNGLGKAYETHK